MYKLYITFEHTYVLLDQDHYTALSKGDLDVRSNTGESINKILKTFSSSGTKIVQIVFRYITIVYNLKMDHN